MNEKITCILPSSSIEDLYPSINDLRESDLVSRIYIVGARKIADIKGAEWFLSGSLYSSFSLKAIASGIDSKYVLFYSKTQALNISSNALERMIQTCEDSGAGMVYSDFYEMKDGKLEAHPVIEYQDGSLRNDFDFGSVVLYRTEALKKAVSAMSANYSHAALYDLRLKVSQNYRLVRIPELLYTEIELDTRKSGEKMFDYVDPRNREVQIEMEHACTDHLKAIGGYLAPNFKAIKFDDGEFDCEATVVIPVKNRVKTISDAIESVLKQKTDFRFNLIIVDNYSTDGTSELIKSYTKLDTRVLHIIPTRKDLGIGGCWNEAINHPKCGKFAIQLDSDDLYINEEVIKTIVSAFYQQNCAMVVGSYQMVNFQLEQIPPGLIDHREWTPENGRNNALRINGLGAPRAFYTPVLRKIKVPNVSYGEDYALGLNISRTYQIGRIYDPLYLCRRWDENSDASLDIAKLNTHNFYKDKIRTIELWARQKIKDKA